jgi:peptidoglycan hydrolase-like protein with peptidoglycan-binding domain
MAQQPTVSAGDTGEWVTYLQQMLAYHQVGSGFQEGDYCPATEQAVSALQQRHGLAVTGQCDEATWAALTGEPEAGEQSETPPDDLAVSLQVEVAAPDEQYTLDELDDLPGNGRRA